MKSVLALTAFIALVSARSITIRNNCADKIWPGIYPVLSDGLGGFPLSSGAKKTLDVQEGYSGRFFGRTDCASDGTCATGSCGPINCTSYGVPPATLAQFTLNGYANADYFGPSDVQGLNLAVSIIPSSGCTSGTVSCTTGNGAGTGCDETAACPDTTTYTVQFC